ncbi:acyltransferase family protein [Virgibacillus sp. W0181]|uniref:acyltransferase family protein n=1 Tax=Virgibacillus sp. W0181 TaxID=3391581 RepID=UPI003F47F45F
MEREAYFDNAKVILIFLVVFGHVIQPFTDGSHAINTLYTWIYTFHMPAFIFIAGFFAKGIGNKNYVWMLAKKLLFPYIIFQLVYTAFYFYIGKETWSASIFHPHWSLWFLISLFCWHALLIMFKKMPATTGIGLAVLIGLTIGYIGEIGHSFSLSRTFVFFPYFLLGYWLKKEHVMMLKNKSFKIVSLVILVGVALVIYFAPEINSGWLLASKSYIDLGLPTLGAPARMLVYATSSVMALCVLAWVPKRRFIMTDLGTRTLYIYLLHGFFIQYFRQNNFFEVNNVIDFAGLLIITTAIMIFLSSKLMIGIWQPIIEGKTTILKNTWNQKRKTA